MLKMKKNKIEIINIKNLNVREKYIKLWKKKYNINIETKKESMEEKIINFIKS
jgi:hypothetical protein